MAQKLVNYKLGKEKGKFDLTGFGGLSVFLDFIRAIGFERALKTHLNRGQDAFGLRLWRPSDTVLSLLLLNLTGGESIDDLEKLKADSGFGRLLDMMLEQDLSGDQRKVRRALKASQGAGSFPSASTVFRFLKGDGREAEGKRQPGKAYIPPAGQTVRSLGACNRSLLKALCANSEYGSVTLDMDATLIKTNKEQALYSYKKFAAYQPLNVWWAEQRVMLWTQFRDGNVPAGFGLKEVLAEALEALPSRGVPLYLRSDTAGYKMELLKFCEDEGIAFAVGCPVTSEFRLAVRALPEEAWQKMDKRRECAELCFVPNALATTRKRVYEFRYMVTRELMQEQRTLFDDDSKYPFPVERLEGAKYKIHGVVTNRDLPAADLIEWYYGRCGNSEEAHAVLKNDLAGGRLPCGNFQANASWWWLAVLAHNIHSAFKKLCCRESWLKSRLKRMRFKLINLPGRVLERGRELYLRVSQEGPAYGLLEAIRRAILKLRPPTTA